MNFNFSKIVPIGTYSNSYTEMCLTTPPRKFGGRARFCLSAKAINALKYPANVSVIYVEDKWFIINVDENQVVVPQDFLVFPVNKNGDFFSKELLVFMESLGLDTADSNKVLMTIVEGNTQFKAVLQIHLEDAIPENEVLDPDSLLNKEEIK